MSGLLRRAAVQVVASFNPPRATVARVTFIMEAVLCHQLRSSAVQDESPARVAHPRRAATRTLPETCEGLC